MQSASRDVGNGDVEIVRQSSRGMSVENQRWLLLFQALPKSIAQTFDALTAVTEIAECQLCRFGKSDDQWHRQGARSQASFLSSSQLQRVDREVWVADQGANPFGSVQFVGAQAEKICAKTLAVEGDVAEGLSGIAVQSHTIFAADGRDFRERLNHPDFVVGQHHADQLGVFGDGGLKLLVGKASIWLW